MGRNIKIRGLKPIELKLQHIEAEQLRKCAKGNDIWAFAVVECWNQLEEKLKGDEEDIPKFMQNVVD
jgi:hypothetical protein